MKSEPSPERTSLAYVIGILGAFLIVGGLVLAMRHYVQPPALGKDRAAERSKALADLRGEDAQVLHSTAWIDQGKGLVRLRIEDAMTLVEREWQNPPAARSNLIARIEKATFIPPPPPNPFE